MRSKISLVARSSNGLRVVVGTLSLTTGGIAHTSAKHESHPGFNSSSSSNDVGLVKTVTTIVFNAVTKPIVLGDQKLRGGENAVFSGWVSERVVDVIALFSHVLTSVNSTIKGASDRNELIPRNRLQWMRTTTITNFDCREKFLMAGESDVPRITDETICTFFSKIVSLCYYDKGGPLVVDDKVVAIANKQTCNVGTPDTFTRVLPYLAWIRSTIDEPTQ